MEFKIKKIIPAQGKLEYRSRLKCYTGVSISNTFFTGETSLEFFKWLERNFSSICIFIDDYFHKYNEMSFTNRAELECIHIARIKGDEIEKSINETIDKLGYDAIKFKVIRSTYLAQSDLFLKNQKFFTELFDSSFRFKDGILEAAKDYMNRQINRGNSFLSSNEKVKENCCKYLINEIAIFTTLCEMGYTVEVYPGPELKVLEDIANGLYINMPKSLLKRINIELKLKKR